MAKSLLFFMILVSFSIFYMVNVVDAQEIVIDPIIIEPINLDIVPPKIILPDDIKQEANYGELGSIIKYTVTAKDDVDERVSVSCDPPSGYYFTLGITTVICNAKDSSGNISEGKFLIEITENLEFKKFEEQKTRRRKTSS